MDRRILKSPGTNKNQVIGIQDQYREQFAEIQVIMLLKS